MRNERLKYLHYLCKPIQTFQSHVCHHTVTSAKQYNTSLQLLVLLPFQSHPHVHKHTRVCILCVQFGDGGGGLVFLWISEGSRRL